MIQTIIVLIWRSSSTDRRVHERGSPNRAAQRFVLLLWRCAVAVCPEQRMLGNQCVIICFPSACSWYMFLGYRVGIYYEITCRSGNRPLTCVRCVATETCCRPCSVQGATDCFLGQAAGTCGSSFTPFCRVQIREAIILWHPRDRLNHHSFDLALVFDPSWCP